MVIIRFILPVTTHIQKSQQWMFNCIPYYNWIYLISIHHASKRIFSIFKCFFELFDVNLINRVSKYWFPIIVLHVTQWPWRCPDISFQTGWLYEYSFLWPEVFCLQLPRNSHPDFLQISLAIQLFGFCFFFLDIWSWQCLWTELLNNQTLLQVFIFCFLLLNPGGGKWQL